MTFKLTIATRESELALWQSRYVCELIKQHTHYLPELLPMTTEGDQRLDVSLNKIGGKGLFLKELEHSILSGESDLAVHSMKDVPADLPEEFKIVAVLPRADYSDALISNKYSTLLELPNKAIVGTSSLRRQAQLLSLRPDLNVIPLRGNVNTRLKKLDEGQYDAIILASAGLIRLGMSDRIQQRLTVPQWMPAVAQGAIGIECASDNVDMLNKLSVLNDQNTAQCIHAERAFNQRLGGSCSVAIGAYAEACGNKNELNLQGCVYSADGKQTLSARGIGHNPSKLGIEVAEQLIEKGAMNVLKAQQ